MADADHADLAHDPLCDWNLYPESRGHDRPGVGEDPPGCNLDCAEHPEKVAAHWERWRD